MADERKYLTTLLSRLQRWDGERNLSLLFKVDVDVDPLFEPPAPIRIHFFEFLSESPTSVGPVGDFPSCILEHVRLS